MTLISEKLVKHNVFIQHLKINLFGVTGSDTKIQTRGIAHGELEFENNSLGIAMHLVEQKYAGIADGFLGFDFLYQYKSIMDLANKKLIYQLHLVANVSFTKCTRSEKIKIVENDENESDECMVNEKALVNIRVIENEPENILNNIGTEKGSLNIVLSNFGTDNGNHIILRAKNRLHATNEGEPSESWSYVLNALNECEMNEYNSYKEMENAMNSYILAQENNLYIGAGTFKIPRKIFNVAYMNEKNELKDQSCLKMTELCPNIVFRSERAKHVFNKLQLKHCTCDERQKIAYWCNQFQNQFFVDGDKLSSTNVIKHKIRLLPGAQAIKVKQYRIRAS